MDFINNKLGVDFEDEDNEADDDEEVDEDAEEVDDDSNSKSSNEGDEESNKPEPNVFRSKGFFWLASRPSQIMIWSQAGGLFQTSPGGSWWIDTPKDEWPTDAESVAEINADWIEETGDRRQELVFIGTNLDKQDMITSLEECLLDDAEMALGSESWAQLEDPFPVDEESEAGDGSEAGDVSEAGDGNEEVTMVTEKTAKKKKAGQ
jgi:Cobalamin synthesis protein cobW C-terminal domain